MATPAYINRTSRRQLELQEARLEQDVATMTDDIDELEDKLAQKKKKKVATSARLDSVRLQLRASAADKVIGTVELLESILLQMPARDAIRSVRVKSCFRDTIIGSAKLRRHVFLDPKPTEYKLVAQPAGRFRSKFELHRGGSNSIVHTGDVAAVVALHPGLVEVKTKDWSRLTFELPSNTKKRVVGIGLDAFITNPPCKKLYAGSDPRLALPRCTFLVDVNNGITFGHLFLQIRKQLDSYHKNRHPLWDRDSTQAQVADRVAEHMGNLNFAIDRHVSEESSVVKQALSKL